MQTQYQDKGGIVRTGEIVADQPAGFVIHAEKSQSKGSGDVGEQEDDDEEASLVGETIVEEDAGEDADGDENPIRNLLEQSISALNSTALNQIQKRKPHLHQSRNECGEPKPFDNDGAEIADPSIRDIPNDAN